MGIKKTIALIQFICCLALSSIAQNVLPYTQDNICLDQLINVNINSLTNAKNLVVADFNNDNIKEVVVTDATASIIKIYSFIPASGSFSLQNFFFVPGTFGTGKNQAIAAGEFNGDAYKDLVFTTDSFIYVFKNQTNFNFNLLNNNKIPIPNNFVNLEHNLKVDNINNAGADEFYFISPNSVLGPGLIVMPYLNTPTYSLVPQTIYTIFPSTTFLATTSIDINIGDVKNDLDGKNDVMITCSSYADNFYFLENNSNATTLNFNVISKFIPPPFPFSTPYYSIYNSEMADLNADNKLDFIFYGNSVTSDKIVVFGGNNNFNLNVSVDIPFSGINIHDFKISDINNDAIPDFVGIGNYSLSAISGIILYPGNNNASTYFNQLVTITFTNSNMKLDELQVTDVDNNGINDIVIKPWKISTDRTYMIPNFSYTLSVTATPSIICGANAATLTAVNSSTSTNYNWEFVPTTSVVSTNSTFTTITTGQYLASLDIDMYSNYTCTQKSDTVKISSNAPIINISTPPNITICKNNTITTTASGAATYTWYSSSTGFVSNGQTILIPGISANTFTVVGMLTNGCKGTAVINVNLHPLNTDVINASKNPACAGDAVTLSFPSAISYTWSNNETTQNIIVTPSLSALYQVTLTDVYGCISSKTIRIDIDPDCIPKIYHGISLNGDGYNDVFTIDNIENFKGNHVSIFNRWGREIFVTNNYNNKDNFWPKKEDQSNIMPSTYFYMINFGDGSPIQKGWIEVIKN